MPHMGDDRGTSLMLVNSDAGAQVLKSLSEVLICESVNIEKAIRRNSAAIRSVKMNSKRAEFFHAAPTSSSIWGLIKEKSKVEPHERIIRKIQRLLR